MNKYQFGKHHFEPVWHAEKRMSKSKIPEGLIGWLLDNTSLTQRLKAICHDSFSVRILAQGWARPMLNEARKLKIHESKHAFIRQVYLFCHQQPVVFARTVIPARTIRGRMRRLTNLGTKPLGEVLFNDPKIQRQDKEIAKICVEHTLHRLAMRHQPKQKQAIWGRRSIFTYHKKPILLSEIFLPAEVFGYIEYFGKSE